jgi:hypothetical protein
MRCAAITSAGARCKLEASYGSYCYQHAPEMAEERKRRASKGGRTGGNGRGGQSEISDLKTQLEDLAQRVLSGELETGRAAVANQLINTRPRAIEQERKNKETADLEARVEALERRQGITKGGRRWGA